MSGDLVLVKNLNVDGLAKPVTALVNKVSYALGGPFKGAFRPMQIRRVAEAEADAIRIRAHADADAAEIRLRAANRVLAEEMRNQANIEAVLSQAAPRVTEEAEPEKIEDDWIVNLFDKCRIVSDEQMQDVFARILAGEANNPGTFSRKTINILGDMDKEDADLFTTLCCFVWTVDGASGTLIYGNEPIYSNHGVTIPSLTELESLGLVRRSPLGYSTVDMPRRFRAVYFSEAAELTLSDRAQSKFDRGTVVLTTAGLQLGPICDRKPIDGLFEFICGKWKEDPNIESVRVLG